MIRPRRAALCCAILLGSSALPALAQDRARSLVLDVSQGLEVASNPELVEAPRRDEVVLRSDVDLRYATATRAQRLELGFGGQVEAGAFNSGSDSRVADRRADLAYSRDTASGGLRIAASYSRARIEDATVLEDFDSGDLDVTTGERGLARLGFALDTGRDRRIGTEIEGALSSLRYFGNDGEGRDSADLQAALRLSLTGRTDLLLLSGLTRDDYTSEDGATTRTGSVGFGLRHDLTERQRLHAELRAMRLDRTETSDATGLRDTNRQDGLGAAAGWEADLGRGTLGVDVETALHAIGRRDLAQLWHRATSEAGSLSVSLGVVDSDRLRGRPLLNAEWLRNLARGRLQLALEQEADGTEDGDQEVVRSTLAAGYVGRINAVSSWETTISVVDSDEVGPEAEDARRSELTLGYRHALARNWDLAVRYRHVLSESSRRDDRRDNSLFLGLATRIALR